MTASFTRRQFAATAAACALAACGSGGGPRAVAPSATGRVHRYSDDLDAVIAPDADVEKIAEGFVWTEGPAWSPSTQELVFTDTGVEAIYSWSASGGVARLAPPAPLSSGRAIGLAFGPNGRLYYADARGGLGVWDRAAGAAEILAQGFEGSPFNGVNDVAAARDGAVYITDHGGRGDALPVNGVYRLVPGGEMSLASDAFDRPNGVAVSSADGSVLVSNTLEERPVVTRLGASADDPAEVAFDASRAPEVAGGRLLDGLAIGPNGHVFVASGAGVWVVSTDGEALGLLETGTATSNVVHAGSDLLITAANMLARVSLTLG